MPSTENGLPVEPCWCRLIVGYVTHAEGAPCPTREHWLEVEDSEHGPAFRVTCDDLGCVNGRTVQGRKYGYDGTHEDQWAPCARQADTCPIPPDGEVA